MKAVSSLILSFLILSVRGDKQLANLFETEIKSLAVESLPSELYLENIKIEGDIILDTFDLPELEDRLTKVHFLPEEIKNLIRGIVFTETTVFHTFVFEISHWEGHLIEYVGAAKNTKGVVEIAYVSVSSRGEVNLQYSERYQDCRKIFNRMECDWQYRTTPVQKPNIRKILRAAAYTHLKNISKNLIPAMAEKSFVLSNNSKLYSNNENFYLKIQDDGNVVLYYVKKNFNDIKNGLEGHPIWSTNTYTKGTKPYLLAVENNGQIKLWDADLHEIWSTSRPFEWKYFKAPFRLIVEDDGRLNLYDSNKNVVWNPNNKYEASFLSFIE
jgi:hypothetical protein